MRQGALESGAARTHIRLDFLFPKENIMSTVKADKNTFQAEVLDAAEPVRLG